jgi:uncharacterized protein YjiS (DUF1127 family)
MNIFRGFQNWRLYRDTTFELRQLSDRELGDLGIARGDIRRVARDAAKNF